MTQNEAMSLTDGTSSSKETSTSSSRTVNSGTTTAVSDNWNTNNEESWTSSGSYTQSRNNRLGGGVTVGAKASADIPFVGGGEVSTTAKVEYHRDWGSSETETKGNGERSSKGFGGSTTVNTVDTRSRSNQSGTRESLVNSNSDRSGAAMSEGVSNTRNFAEGF